MTTPRRQRWLEPQARLMNAGVSFPSSSVQEFYSHGGSGGFGLPFIAPPWGFASNYTSSSSHTVSSTNVVKPIVKSDVTTTQKKVEKTPEQIYEEEAFPDKRKVDKIAYQIYEEEAFTDKPKAEMGRLSKPEQDFLDNPNNSHIANIEIYRERAKKGREAEKKGDYVTEAFCDREIQEWLTKQCKMRFHLDPVARKAYAYNSIAHHYISVVEKILAEGYTIDDVFEYYKPTNEYYIKSEYEKEFIDRKIVSNTSLLIFSNNKHK